MGDAEMNQIGKSTKAIKATHPTIWRGHSYLLASASFFPFVWDANFGSVGAMTRV